jgi:hypothetical protein
MALQTILTVCSVEKPRLIPRVRFIAGWAWAAFSVL